MSTPTRTGPRYFLLRDQAHRLCVVAGDEFDGHAYHEAPTPPAGHGQPTAPAADGAAPEPPALRDNAQWRFEDAGDGTYFLIDRRHGAALVAGDDYDGHVYHARSHEGRANARWRLVEPMTVKAEKGVFHLVDAEHGRALVAGDEEVGHLYHQDPGARANALWAVELAEDGVGGPATFIAHQKLVAVTYDSGAATRADLPPRTMFRRVSIDASSPQSLSLAETYQEKQSETVTFQAGVTTGLLLSLSGWGSAGVVKVETKAEVKFEYGFSRTTAATSERSTTIEWKVPLRSAARPVYVDGELKRARTTVPFEATVETTYGDGRVEQHVEKGTWSNVAYTTGAIRFTEG